MTTKQFLELTAGERNYLRQFEKRLQPRCPGCGCEMRAGVEMIEWNGIHWEADYHCSRELGGCGVWMTAVSRNRSAIGALEAAYRQAMEGRRCR